MARIDIPTNRHYKHFTIIITPLAHSKQQRSLTGTEQTGSATMISVRIQGVSVSNNLYYNIRCPDFLRSLQTNEEIMSLSNSRRFLFSSLIIHRSSSGSSHV